MWGQVFESFAEAFGVTRRVRPFVFAAVVGVSLVLTAVSLAEGGPRGLFAVALLLALGLGASTYKLKFGHRGANHPVKFLDTGAVEITSQNHGFAVDPDSLPAGIEITHKNLYDGTVEGIRHTSKPLFSVQYHPEASPGPHDADYLFRQFVDLIEKN